MAAVLAISVDDVETGGDDADVPPVVLEAVEAVAVPIVVLGEEVKNPAAENDTGGATPARDDERPGSPGSSDRSVESQSGQQLVLMEGPSCGLSIEEQRLGICVGGVVLLLILFSLGWKTG